MHSSVEFRGERIKEALQRILVGQPQSRIKHLVDVFQQNGCKFAEDLKYFDRGALLELQTLNDVEMFKIAIFVRRNYPEEYEEHEKKRTEMNNLEREIKRIKKAAEFQNQKSDLQRKEATMMLQFEERKDILDDISRLTGEYAALNRKKLKDCLKDKEPVREIFKFMKRKEDSKELLEKIKAKSIELDRKEPQLGRPLKE